VSETVTASARLDQPWRAAIAAGEVVVAVLAVLAGLELWGVGVTTLITPLGPGQPPLVATIFYGNWMAYAILLVTAAAILVLDAIREILLAVRTRTKPLPPEETVAPLPADS
jgi:hypothetical protein